jgi:hypothetical protein
MALNPMYIVSPPLQEYFVDKDTGAPLSNGYVLFSIDNARSTPKPVYQLTGSPPNYNYIEYGFLDPISGLWRVDLNIVGTFDNVVYYYPYDAEGNVQLYFVEVFSTDAPIIGPPSVLQFTRQAWPPDVFGSVTPVGTPVEINYIPNGQVLLHNEIPADIALKLKQGQVRQPITQIAYGGFTFERPSASTATDFVSFPRYGSFIEPPAASPRYAVEIQCQSPNAGDTYKDIRIRFDDVNKFNNTDPTVLFTFAFNGISNTLSNLNVQFILYKNFGTGGSAPTTTNIATFTLTPATQEFFTSFSFGDNSTETIGPNDDDYLQLIIRFPTNVVFDASLTDFILTDGNISMPIFPSSPNSEFKYQGIAGFMPVPNPLGFDLFCSLRLTLSGLEFDHSEIGKIYATSYITPNVGELLCNGTQYDSLEYSSDGIPYARLQAVLFDVSSSYPVWGTGLNYVSSYVIDSDLSALTLLTNLQGAVTAPADGTPPTGFTFYNIYTSGIATGAQGYWEGASNAATVYIWNDGYGAVPIPTAGTTSFTGTQLLTQDAPEARAISGTQVAFPLSGGEYWEFNTNYMWFTVSGVGVDPLVPGRTGIQVNLTGGDSTSQVARNIASAASTFQTDRITCVPAGSITPGANWLFSSPGFDFYVWYTIDGAGTDPAYPNKVAILVALLSTDTVEMVASKTVIGINSRYFATPQLSGYFLRGINSSLANDPGERGSANCIVASSTIGTIEFSANLQHEHTYLLSSTNIVSGTTLQTGTNFDVTNTDTPTITTITNGGSSSGIAESRPLNVAVNYVIKY